MAKKSGDATPALRGEIPHEIRADALALLLGLTTRWLGKLREQGVLKSRNHGHYLFADSIRSWGDHREAAGYERARKEFSGGASFSDDAPVSAGERVKFERARKLQMENDATALITVGTPDAISVVDWIVGRMRTRISGIPSKTSEDVATRRRLENAIDAELHALSSDLEKAGRALAAGKDPNEALEEDDA